MMERSRAAAASTRGEVQFVRELMEQVAQLMEEVRELN